MWATGGARPVDEDNTLSALRAFGATPQQLKEVRDQFEQRRRDEVFAVWPENWRAVDLFLTCGTQWDRIARGGMSGGFIFTGLNYSRLDSVEARMPPRPGEHVPEPRELLRQIRVLEIEALPLLNEQ